MSDTYMMTVDLNVLGHPGINLFSNNLGELAAAGDCGDERLKESSRR